MILICFIVFIFTYNDVKSEQVKEISDYVKIIDGDTIKINSKKIRLHGIDAPELKQKCILNKKKWDCGKQSKIELNNLVNDQIVECIVKDIDIYDRYIAICFTKSNNLNRLMVKKGWALAYRYYSSDYILEEKYAEDNKLGIWEGVFENPYIYRKKNKH